MDITKIWISIAEGWQVKIVLASIFTYLFGDYNAGLGALLCLVVLDFITKICALSKEVGGFSTAWKTDVISSEGMKQSIQKGLWYMALLIVARQMEQFTVLGMSVKNTAVEITCAYLAVIEAKSILENLRDTGMKNLEPFIAILGEKQKKLTGKED
jgi:phage-related holin